MPFFWWHEEGQSLLHNVLGASAILTLRFASRTCSCYHICAVACTVCVLVHSRTPFWNMLMSFLKEETHVELPGEFAYGCAADQQQENRCALFDTQHLE